jgi:glycosyltransferase involved in cell wall biosynthesis
MPDISICMITYNHEAFINQAINSILLQQTNYSFQLVIGEDFSTDSTRLICEDYAAKFPDKIKLLPSEKNYGIVPNFIRTLNACDGRYIAICEGDDYWIADNKLQLQASFLEKNSDYIICAGRSEYLGYKGEIINRDGRVDKNKIDFTVEDYLLRMSFETATIMYRNNTSFKLPESFKNVFSADQFLVLLLTMNGGKIRYIDKDLAMYRYHQGGITKQTKRKVVLERLFAMLDDFDAISGGKYSKYIILRKRFTLISWNHFLLNYPERLSFLCRNIGFAIQHKKTIPFTLKTLLHYLAPFKNN